jgi:hypothetical protein
MTRIHAGKPFFLLTFDLEVGSMGFILYLPLLTYKLTRLAIKADAAKLPACSSTKRIKRRPFKDR